MKYWVLEAKTSDGLNTSLYYIETPRLFTDLDNTMKFDSKEEAAAFKDRMMLKDKKVRYFIPTEFEVTSFGSVRKTDI